MEATTARDPVRSNPAVAVTGRVMFALIFFLSGVTHFTNTADYVALMPPAIPFRPFWVMISAVRGIVLGVSSTSIPQICPP